jgi:hypothetical protein
MLQNIGIYTCRSGILISFFWEKDDPEAGLKSKPQGNTGRVPKKRKRTNVWVFNNLPCKSQYFHGKEIPFFTCIGVRNLRYFSIIFLLIC